MDSITKPKLTSDQLGEICRTHLCEPLESAEELKEGWFNAAFHLRGAHGNEAILKVAPPDSVRLMRYEENLMHAEVAALRLVKHMTAVPVPSVIAYDISHEISDSDYFLTEKLSGKPLDSVRPQLSDENQFEIGKQIGSHLKEIHGIQSHRFGTFNCQEFTTWADAFTCLMDWLRMDAGDLKIQIPHKAFEAANHLQWSLEHATVPTLVHWDLWDGNVFVDPQSATITGYIDFERVLWANPLIEANFGHIQPGFLTAYGADVLDGKSAQARRLIYDLYLSLIMVIESTFRRFSTAHESEMRKKLDQNLQRIEAFRC